MGGTSTTPTITDGDLRKIIAAIGADMTMQPDGTPRANAAMAALVALCTGMTAGEVCGLAKGDCKELEATRYGRIRIDACMRDGGQRQPIACRGVAQLRTITAENELVRRMREFAGRHNVTSRRAPLPIIASYTSGRRIAWTRPARVAAAFRAMCEREGLGGRYTFASLRRTHAAMLLRAGVPADVVAVRLGIADPVNVAMTYAAECAEGMERRGDYAARVNAIVGAFPRDPIWGVSHAWDRAAVATFSDAFAQLVAG